MKKIKKIITIGLAAAMILGMTLTTSAASPAAPCPYCRSVNVTPLGLGPCTQGCDSWYGSFVIRCNNCSKTYHYCSNHGIYK